MNTQNNNDNVTITGMLSQLSGLSILLYMTFFIANDYMTIIMSKLISNLKIRSDIVGILLLNFGNGLPDLITSLLLCSYSNTVEMAIYSTVGSAVIMSSVALGAVILSSNKRNYVDFATFYKNLFWFVATFCIYMYLLAVQTVDIYFSILSLCSYIFFLVTSFYFSQPHNDSVELINEPTESVKSLQQIIFSRVNGILRLAFDLFILSYKDKTRIMPTHFYGMLSPPMNFLVICLFNNIVMPFSYFTILAISCFILGGFLTYGLSKGRFESMIYLYSFFISCYYLYIVTSLILNTVLTLSELLQIPKVLTATLIISAGNCLGDFITLVSGSRKGLFKTSANACLTAPIHNTLFNLAIGLLYSCYLNGFVDIPIYLNECIYVGLAFLPLISVNLVLNYEIRNRKFASELGLVLLFIYVLYGYFTILQYATSKANK